MISTHVPNLELCKKLRDLGWNKETMFWWIELTESSGMVVYGKDDREYEMLIPAPTVGEMLKVMPRLTAIVCGIKPDELAEMLCKYIKNNLVKLEEKE